MNQDLSRVDRREEIAAEKWNEQEGCEHEGHEADHERPTMRERNLQQIAIPIAKAREPLLEAALEAHERIGRVLLLVFTRTVRLEQILRHGRDERAREDE